MVCIPFPKSLCVELERIIARFQWQKTKGKRGLHWCEWKKLCDLKENKDLCIKSFENFNIALLAKQGWSIMTRENSLLIKVLKEKYIPISSFLDSSLKFGSLYTWQSIWSAKKVFQDRVGWHVGNRVSILVFNHNWILGVIHSHLV